MTGASTTGSSTTASSTTASSTTGACSTTASSTTAACSTTASSTTGATSTDSATGDATSTGEATVGPTTSSSAITGVAETAGFAAPVAWCRSSAGTPATLYVCARSPAFAPGTSPESARPQGYARRRTGSSRRGGCRTSGRAGGGLARRGFACARGRDGDGRVGRELDRRRGFRRFRGGFGHDCRLDRCLVGFIAFTVCRGPGRRAARCGAPFRGRGSAFRRGRREPLASWTPPGSRSRGEWSPAERSPAFPASRKTRCCQKVGAQNSLR